MKAAYIALLQMVSLSVLLAQVPHTMSYQGVLTTSSGVPVVDSLYTLQFSLQSTSVAGSPIFTETHPGVPVAHGTYHVILGALSAGGIVLPPGDSLFVEVTIVAGPVVYGYPQTFSPRTLVTSAPFALRADTALYARTGAGGGSGWLPLP